MKSDKALVILSGGQDSTTCLAQAVHDYGAKNVYAITFFYGQRHSAEVDVAKAVASHFGVAEHKVIPLDWYNQITTNALLDHEMKIEKTAKPRVPTPSWTGAT